MPGASLNPLKLQWDIFFFLFELHLCVFQVPENVLKSVNTILVFLKAYTKFSAKLMLLGRPKG